MARDLQINDTTLGNWVTADQAERGVPDATGLLPLTATERAELTKLRRENAKLRVERQILIIASPREVRSFACPPTAELGCHTQLHGWFGRTADRLANEVAARW